MALQARTEFAAAINQIASEKGVDVQVILDAIKTAALAAYRKDLSYRNEAIPDDFEELEAKLDPASGEIGIFRGEENITPPGFARIAAQTAKQVIAQKLHEAEKGAIHEEYAQKVGLVVSGTVQRHEGNTYFVDIGRAEGIMPPQEQTKDEFYAPGTRMKFLIKEIRDSGHGPEVIVSRSDASLVKGLFGMEVPELQSGSVEIKEIAREAGGRTKVAVASNQDGVDPVGSLVGQKGVRVQAVINELGEEKIDIISYSDDPARFIAAALSPAKDIMVQLKEEERVAKVQVPERELSLAIGKGGQNVRLAAKLTGWKIDIEGQEGSAEEEAKELQALDEPKVEGQEEIKKVEENIDEAIKEESLDGATQEEPSEEEAGKAVKDAEEDMEEDPEMKKSSGGDIVSDGEQSEIGESGKESDEGNESNEGDEGKKQEDSEEGGEDGETASEGDTSTSSAASFDNIEEERKEKKEAAEEDKNKD